MNNGRINFLNIVDCLGGIYLKTPCFDLCQKIGKNLWYSRNAKYYSTQTIANLEKQRTKLYNLISNDNLKNYVLLDHIINYSAKCYYTCLNQKNLKKESNEIKKCLDEDVQNIVSLFENKEIKNPKNTFPPIQTNIIDRHIEMDNKFLIYTYALNYHQQNKDIITTGLGSVLIGPFFKALYNNNYFVLTYSRYANGQINSQKTNLQNYIDLNLLKNKNYVVLDDNIGSGLTTEYLMDAFNKNGYNCIFSSIEFDWIIYKQIKQNLSPYKPFNPQIYERISFLNTRNHRFLVAAINCLTHSPEKYIAFLKQHKYHKIKPDIITQFNIGKTIAKHFLPKSIYKKHLNYNLQLIKTIKNTLLNNNIKPPNKLQFKADR